MFVFKFLFRGMNAGCGLRRGLDPSQPELAISESGHGRGKDQFDAVIRNR